MISPVLGNGGNDSLSGGDGNDRLSAGGDAIVNGGAGDDQLRAFFSGFGFTGGAGHDVLVSAFAPARLSGYFLDYNAAEDQYSQFPPS